MSLPFLARYVSETVIMAMLYHLGPSSPYMDKYGEIASAITRASNQDPLFPQYESGGEATAAILVALAYKESSFHQNVLGDKGKSFGLFQIQPPTARVKGQILLIPLSASLIAVDLIRTSFRQCSDRPWVERLAWYVASNGCTSHPVIVKKSMERLMLAQQLFVKFFPQAKLPERVPMLTEHVEERPQ